VKTAISAKPRCIAIEWLIRTGCRGGTLIWGLCPRVPVLTSHSAAIGDLRSKNFGSPKKVIIFYGAGVARTIKNHYINTTTKFL
jgi:hypothetical protein